VPSHAPGAPQDAPEMSDAKGQDGVSRDLAKEAGDFLERARTHSAEWRGEAREDYGFAAGEQWSEEDKQVLREQLRPIITFNRIGPVLDAVSGSEVANRQEVRYIPREEGDVGVNELFTDAAKWVRDQSDAEDEESDAFVDVCTCGMGWTETRMDYSDDPDGRIVIERVDPLEMYWDPAAQKRNLSDARAIARVKDISREDFAALWPDKLDDVSGPKAFPLEDDDFPPQPHAVDSRDRYDGNDRPRAGSRGESTYRVIEYQWCERAPLWRVVNPTTGEVADMEKDQFRALSAAAREQNSTLRAVKQLRKVWRRAFVCGEVVLEHGDVPGHHGFTYKAITGKRDRNRNTWFGLVRAMKDPQRWANKWLSQVLHIVNTNAKGGLLAEQDAFANPRKAEESWADPSAITWVRPGGIPKIQMKPAVTYPVGLDRLMEFAISSIRDVTGVNLELLGLADRDQPGILEHQRKQAGLTILAALFDSLRRYRKEQGRLLLHFMSEYISDGRLIRIAGPGGARYAALAREPSAAAYDVVVDDAPTSPNLKERVFGTLTQLLPVLMKAGIPIPPSVLDYAPLPSSLAAEWKQLLMRPAALDPKLWAKQQRLELDKTRAALQLQLERERAQQQATLKAAELQSQIERDKAKLAHEIELERARAQANLKSGTHVIVETAEHEVLRDAVEQLKSMAEEQRQALSAAIQTLADSSRAAARAMTAPRRLIRDREGRPIAVETIQ